MTILNKILYAEDKSDIDGPAILNALSYHNMLNRIDPMTLADQIRNIWAGFNER